MSVNEAILVGRLGQDPDVKFTAQGMCVVNCSLATSDYYNNEEHTEWHRIVVWGKPAEAFGNLCRKGSLVYARGKIQTEQWEDAQGQKRYTTKINVQQWKGLANFGDSEGGAGASKGAPKSQGATRASAPPASDDDIPF